MRRDVRAARRNPTKRAHLDVPVEDEREDDEHDGYQPIREREPIPMRDGSVIDPKTPWQFPQ